MAATPSGSPLPGQTCSQSSGTFPASGTLVLQKVTVGAHQGHDQVVFAFTSVGSSPAGSAVSYTVAPAQAPFLQDGSGAVLRIAGQSFLSVKFYGAAGHDPINTPPKATYQGPLDFTPRLAALTEVRRTGDFEGTLAWVLGESHHTCWAVSQLANPPSLVVDLAPLALKHLHERVKFQAAIPASPISLSRARSRSREARATGALVLTWGGRAGSR
ncbi:MAG: hypothetical protein NVSMB32_11880 [Actinomycetota bacterium]